MKYFDKVMKIVALLDTFWSWGGFHRAGDEAPRYFRINPNNFTGRRLYRICGPGHKLLVTDSCRFIVSSANGHGTPDPDWVAENLKFLAAERMDLLLVCGRVAKETYQRCGFEFSKVLLIDHPAARRWTNVKLDNLKAQIDSMA